MKRVSLVRAVASAVFLLAGACGVVLQDYTLDTSVLDQGFCEQGQLRCDADWLTTCNPTLNGWVKAEGCDLSELCNSSAGRCNTCRPGTSACKDANLVVCRSDGSAWDVVEQCESPGKCNVNLEACVACTPGEYQCNLGAWSLCGGDGSWVTPPTMCAPAELCFVGADRKTGGCKAPMTCSPGTYTCDGAALKRCDEQGVVQQTIDSCATAELCLKAANGTGVKQCPPPACEMGSFGCNGNTLQSCKGDRTGFADTTTLCTADSPCNPAAGNCSKCTVGSSFCQGASLLRCNSGGAYEKVQDCASTALCDAANGTCKPPECEAKGLAVCDAQQNALRVCEADLTWGKDQICDTLALCNAVDGRCEQPFCARGATRCNHGNVETCNPGRTGWDLTENCAAGTECDPVTGGCQPAGCNEGTSRCNDVFLEKCSGNVWTRVARCVSHGRCSDSAGQCNPPECTPGQFKCEGPDLSRCRDDGTWVQVDTCEGMTMCDAVGGACK